MVWEDRRRRDGKLSVEMPSEAGEYEFRYYIDSGYGKAAATSARVTVRGSTGSGSSSGTGSSGSGSGASGGAGSGSGASGGSGSGSVKREVIKYTYDGWDVISRRKFFERCYGLPKRVGD